MNAQRVQGLAFSLLAILLSALTITIRPLNQTTELFVMAALILLFGVPHGALDTVFARRIFRLRTIRGWLIFTLVYLALVLLVILLWQAAPVLFLSGFLVISLAHFSGDPAAGTPLVSRILYGGAIIVLPVLLHAQDVSRLFSFLVGETASARVLYGLHLLVWPWLIALSCAAAYSLRTNWLTTAELAAVALLAVFTEPLLAFTVFFCGMHGARHILRTFEYSGRSQPRQLVVSAFAPMLAVLVAALGAFFWLPHLSVETRIIQVVFVGLAALTVPHMLLVERVRSTGWSA